MSCVRARYRDTSVLSRLKTFILVPIRQLSAKLDRTRRRSSPGLRSKMYLLDEATLDRPITNLCSSRSDWSDATPADE